MGVEEREEKVFFAKRTHFKTSDIQLTNCRIMSYEIYRKSGIGFVIGFDMPKKASDKENKAIRRGLGEAGRGGYPAWSTVREACRYLCIPANRQVQALRPTLYKAGKNACRYLRSE